MKSRFPFHSNAVWPSATLVIPFAVIYGLLLVSTWMIAKGTSGAFGAVFDATEITTMRAVILGGAAGVYALFRVLRFHPKCNLAYAAWLKLSPWTAGKPLPLGPMHLVWQDLAVIAILTLIASWRGHVNPALPAMVFGVVYLSVMTILLPFLRQWSASVALGFLWPALALPEIKIETVAGIFVAIAGVIWLGHWKSLRAFPWDTGADMQRRNGSIWQTEIRMEPVTAVGAPANVGWPFTVLGPKSQGFSISTRTAFWLSALFGWWSFCLMRFFQTEPFPEIILVLAIPLGLMRFVIYCSGVLPPFNVWGRIVSGRLLLPGYDKVFLTPLAAVLMSIAGAIVLRRCGDWYPAGESLGMALIWFVVFSGGPTRKNWILTGQHRFRLMNQSRNRQLMRQV